MLTECHFELHCYCYNLMPDYKINLKITKKKHLLHLQILKQFDGKTENVLQVYIMRREHSPSTGKARMFLAFH